MNGPSSATNAEKVAKPIFSQQGKYLVIDGRPVFFLSEPGKPATRLDIFLRWNQFAILARGEGKCNVHELESGDKVSIEGIKTETGLSIVKMERSSAGNIAA